MTVWIIAVLMSTVATAGLLLPLVWRRNRGDNSAAYDIEVYKDQLNQEMTIILKKTVRPIVHHMYK